MRPTTAVIRTVSFKDLESVGYHIELVTVPQEDKEPQYDLGKVFKDGQLQSKEQFYQALYFLGINTRHCVPTVLPETLHRDCNNKVIKAHRISGPERLDTQWVKSKYASNEAKIYSSRMRDMSQILGVNQ